MTHGELIILSKTGEVLVLCYHASCSKLQSSKATLLQKGYEEVTALAKPIQGKAEDSKLEFSIKPGSDVEIQPPVKTLSLQRLKPGTPHPLSFKCYSISGEKERVQLLVKEGGDVVDVEEFEVRCKRKDIKTAEGTPTSAAFMAGGKVGNFNMSEAKVDVVGNQSNSSPTTHNYGGDVNCNKSQTRTAQNLADNGGTMNITQHGTKNTLSIANREKLSE